MDSLLVEAHRGDSAYAPENTLASFRRAVNRGARAIELDVHPSADGALVVIHDEKLSRTTNGHGHVSSQPLEVLRQLDAGSWFAPEYAGERLPLLTEVLDLLQPTTVTLNIEIKAFPAAMAVPETVVRLLRKAGRERCYVVSSFDLGALLEVRAMAPEITLALIGEGPVILERAIEHGLPWIHARHPTVEAGLVAEAHAAGIKVNVWTVDEVERLKHLRAAGIDKVCSNKPIDLMAALRRWPRPAAG